MKKTNEIVVLGFALFAMFFGAGNLIFPPSLGVAMGKDWLVAAIGFLLTGVGLPLLGVMAFTRVGRFEDFASKISHRFNFLYCTLLILVIGPLFAIPRTGSTTFEMGVLPSFPNTDPLVLSIITSVIFFGITLALVLKESRITDIIGKFLTPVLFVILGIITFLGVTHDIGMPVDKNAAMILSRGFVDGYQTMDALASVIFGVVLVRGLESKGVTDVRQQRYFLSGAGVIAALGLGLIYFSLIYLGARVSGAEIGSTTAAILYVAEVTLGSMGKIIFGICVAVACLTTAVGLVAIASDWFSKYSPISYKAWSVIICVFSAVMAIGGVDFIMKLSIPVLCFLYPVTIIIILFNVVGFHKPITFRLATYTTLVVSLLEVVGNTFGIAWLSALIAKIPLADKGFSWVVPCLIAMFLAIVLDYVRKPEKA